MADGTSEAVDPAAQGAAARARYRAWEKAQAAREPTRWRWRADLAAISHALRGATIRAVHVGNDPGEEGLHGRCLVLRVRLANGSRASLDVGLGLALRADDEWPLAGEASRRFHEAEDDTLEACREGDTALFLLFSNGVYDSDRDEPYFDREVRVPCYAPPAPRAVSVAVLGEPYGEVAYVEDADER